MTKLQAHGAPRTGLDRETRNKDAEQMVREARRQRSADRGMTDVGAP